MKEELRPRLRLAITVPSNACTRFLSPSTTFTLTSTLSPGSKSGMVLPRRLISSCSMVLIRSISTPAFFPMFLLELREQSLLFFAHAPHLQQVRTPEPRPSQRLLQPPAPDVLLVAGQQRFRHL